MLTIPIQPAPVQRAARQRSVFDRRRRDPEAVLERALMMLETIADLLEEHVYAGYLRTDLNARARVAGMVRRLRRACR